MTGKARGKEEEAEEEDNARQKFTAGEETTLDQISNIKQGHREKLDSGKKNLH